MEDALPVCFLLPLCDKGGQIHLEEMFAVGQEACIKMLGAPAVQLILQQRQLLIAVSSAETLAAS